MKNQMSEEVESAITDVAIVMLIIAIAILSYVLFSNKPEPELKTTDPDCVSLGPPLPKFSAEAYYRAEPKAYKVMPKVF